MNKGTGIAIGVAVLGASALGYVFYKRSQGAAASTPTGLTPAGTSPSGVQQYINQAGQMVDSGGKLIGSAQNIINTVTGGNSYTPPAAGPLAQYEGKFYRFCSEISKGRCGSTKDNPNNGKFYVIRDGLRRYLSTDAIQTQLNARAQTKDVDAAFLNQFKDGPALAGLSGLSTLLM